MSKKNYPLRRIRYWYVYDVDEICALFGVHHRTVLGWVKKGLPTIDGSKPFLVFGNDLIKFLGKQNAAGKHKTELNEIFCMSCQDIKQPLKRQVQIAQSGHLTNMKGRCPDCKKIMCKGIKIENLYKIKIFFAVVDVLQLYDSANTTANTHLIAHEAVQPSEPPQREMF